MNRHQANNDFSKKAAYYGYSANNIISRAVLCSQDSIANRGVRILTPVSIRPVRNRKRGAQ